MNRESDESSRQATRFRTKDGKPDIRYAAYFRALVRFEGIFEWWLVADGCMLDG